MSNTARITATLLLLASSLTACGGGGSGNTAPGAPAGIPAAIAPPPVVQNPVVFIGLCWLCDSTQFQLASFAELDGETEPASMIEADSVVEARGFRRQIGSYSSISYDALLRSSSAAVGTIEWIDLARGRIGVLGQEVHGADQWVSPTAGLNPGFLRRTNLLIDELRVGDRVRVNGFDSTDGYIAGTGVHRAIAGSSDRVTGTVRSVDAGLRRLQIGSLAIDYSRARIESFPAGEPRVGDLVEAVGTAGGAPRTLSASALRYAESTLELAADSDVTVIGLLTRLATTSVSGTQALELQIAGRSVRIRADCGAQNLRVAQMISARGVRADTGLVGGARCGYLRDDVAGGHYLTGTLASVDAASGVYRILDLELRDQFFTTYTAASAAPISRTDLKPGDRVQVRGLAAPQPAVVVATTITRILEPAGAPLKVEAWMMRNAAGQLEYLGRTIAIDSATRAGFRDCSSTVQSLTPVDASRFMDSAFRQGAGGYRFVTAEIEKMPTGAWRAVTVETSDNVYCD